jgi:hypothetical protein
VAAAAPAGPSVAHRLRAQVPGRGPETALVARDGAGWRTMTWSELSAQVDAAAAAFHHADLRDGDVAVVLLPASARGVVVDLALRSIGVVSLRLADGLAAEDTERALADLGVRLIVSDSRERLEQLSSSELDGVGLLLVQPETWTRFLDLGRERPHQVLTAGDVVRSLHVAPGSVVTELTSVPLPVTVTSDDVVLLLGSPEGPELWEVVAETLAAGAGTAWISSRDDLTEALARTSPTVLGLDARAAAMLNDLMLDAEVGGERWTTDPASVLEAVRAAGTGGGVWARGARRRAFAIRDLRPWFGDRLIRLVTATPVPELAAAACEALGIAVKVRPSPEPVLLTLTPASVAPETPETPEAAEPSEAPAAPEQDVRPGAPPGLAARGDGGSARPAREIREATPAHREKEEPMTNVDVVLKESVGIEGAVAAALVDYKSGMALGYAGDTTALNLDIAAAGNTDVVRSKMRTMESLGLDDQIEDILITLGKAYHLIRLTEGHDGLFLYLVLDKSRANLAMARHKLASLEKTLEI